MNDKGPPSSEKKEMVQKSDADKIPFLDMNMRCSPKGGLYFGIFNRKGNKLNCVGKGTIHKPSSLCVILSGVLNHITKIPLQAHKYINPKVWTLHIPISETTSKRQALHHQFPLKRDIY